MGFSLAPNGKAAAPTFLAERRYGNKSKHSKAARMIRNRISVLNNTDSNILFISTPKSFGPRAWPLDLYFAKLRMNTMEGNAIDEHKTNVATNARH